jgi:hypothetical protein
MSESILAAANCAAISAQSSTHAGAADLRMLAQVELWMAMIREISRERQSRPAFGRRTACFYSSSQNKSTEISVFGEIANVLMHVGRVDLDGFAGAVGRAERNIVKHALHYRLQPPRADILNA